MERKPVLCGIRVLDFTWVLAGPYATRLLADFGAEVIKVVAPHFPEAADAFSRGYYETWNRNKLGITLNPGRPDGVALARRLIAISDVVAENFSPRVMANWGLDYGSVKRIKPDIIMLSMSLMGQESPLRHQTGYGQTVHALSGMTYLTAFPGGQPLGPGFAYADHVAGLYGAALVLAALEERRRTGRGRHIDLAEVGVMKKLLACDDGYGPAGNASEEACPHDVYPCRDGWCAIAVFTEEQWQGLKRAMGTPAWAEERRFSSLKERKLHRSELDRLIRDWTLHRSVRELVGMLQSHGVPAGMVQDAKELAHDPHLAARGFFAGKPEGRLIDRSPIRLAGPAPDRFRPAPRKGQDNDYVYGTLLGLGKAEMEELREKGVI
ncbi:MAG: CoA transferase [Dehalococcoidales bacterium]|nr:CoA transferase [Dehalococcoidales bacterium]